MKIAVCEDNNIVSSYMEDYISSLDLQDIEYEIFSSGDDLIHYMEVENAIFNIYFMDRNARKKWYRNIGIYSFC